MEHCKRNKTSKPARYASAHHPTCHLHVAMLQLEADGDGTAGWLAVRRISCRARNSSRLDDATTLRHVTKRGGEADTHAARAPARVDD